MKYILGSELYSKALGENKMNWDLFFNQIKDYERFDNYDFECMQKAFIEAQGAHQEISRFDHIIKEISGHVREILNCLGQDVLDENIVGTPDRVAKYLVEFLLNYQPGNVDTAFESITADQIVIVKDMPAYSLCSHHMLPMSLTVSVGYLTGSKVIGLSKIPRIVQKHCHKLQLQERLANDIADEVEALLGDCLGVAVFIKGNHLCMSMRGIRSEGQMITSVMRGAFREDASTKEEFLMLVK